MGAKKEGGAAELHLHTIILVHIYKRKNVRKEMHKGEERAVEQHCAEGEAGQSSERAVATFLGQLGDPSTVHHPAVESLRYRKAKVKGSRGGRALLGKEVEKTRVFEEVSGGGREGERLPTTLQVEEGAHRCGVNGEADTLTSHRGLVKGRGNGV